MTDRIDPLLRDEELRTRLETLKADVIQWAQGHELWRDAGFKIPFLHRNEAPREGEVLHLWFEGPLHSMFMGGHEDWDALEEQFRLLLDARGFEYELDDHVSLTIYPKDDGAKRDYLRLHRWQWVQHLSEKRLFDLHAEVFEHFAGNPEALHELHWRKVEEFLDSVFRNQGFRTELGPGTGDGGIDLRLYQSETIPEIVTLVQVKRYKDAIGREPVAALSAIAQMERAQRALFVTTSRYQPAARRFALNTESRLDMPTVELADLDRIQGWCGELSKSLNDYFRTGEQAPPIITAGRRGELAGEIVVASWGYNTTWNTFAVIEADYPHEVVLRPVGQREVSGDGQRGYQVPDETAAPLLEPPRILAFKSERIGSGPTFWADRKLFSLWDGSPQRFDHCD